MRRIRDEEAFAHLVEALRPWLSEILIVGGWAHRLYRLHARAAAPRYAPVLTRDVDLAFRLEDLPQGSMADALAQAGFQEELSGEHVPPVSRYTLGEEDAGYFAEFLVPLYGSPMKRGKPDATAAAAGITAQKLPYLDLLFVCPWTIELLPGAEVPVTEATDLRLPHPVTFIAQKLLIRPARPPQKRAQDVLYIHDTLEMFGPRIDELGEAWRTVIRPQLHPKHQRAIARAAQAQFVDITDAIRGAVRIPTDRLLTPEGVRATCSFGLTEVFEAEE